MTIHKSSCLSEIEVSYKTKVKVSDRPKITDAESAYKILQEVYNPSKIEHVEEFVILLLNRANAVLGWAKISTGGVSGTVCDPKVIFQIALNANASAIVLSHNHPSGNTRPSHQDIELTKRIQEIGKILEISILDHIIVTSESYRSMSNECDI